MDLTKTTSEATTNAGAIRANIAHLDERLILTKTTIRPQAREATGPIRTGHIHPAPGTFTDHLLIDRAPVSLPLITLSIRVPHAIQQHPMSPPGIPIITTKGISTEVRTSLPLRLLWHTLRPNDM